MNELLFPIADYLKGKSVYPAAARILNFLFSVSISSFVFETFYFHYYWLDISDYKAVLNFFIKGDFFIPFSIFIIIHSILDVVSHFVFTLTTFRKSASLLKGIIQYEFNKEHYRSVITSVNNNPVVDMPVVLDKNYLLELYKHLQANITADDWNELSKTCDEQKASVKRNFSLLFKAVVVITIYFVTIPHFGWFLYLLVILVLILLMSLMWIGYLFFDLLPAAIGTFRNAVEVYIEGRTKRKSSEDEPGNTQPI